MQSTASQQHIQPVSITSKVNGFDEHAVDTATYGWAYAPDMPGSRCDPEDEGIWPRSYQLLREDEIWAELSALARPQRAKFSHNGQKTTTIDSLNFQPCLKARTQDRYVVKQLDVHGEMWTLTGVFDGHLGETTVDHVAYHLPIIVGDFLRDALKDSTNISSTFISSLLRSSIIAFDDAIANDVLSLFPGGLDSLEGLSDQYIQSVINDQHGGSGVNYKKARLCMYGTTALVSLVDPQGENMWVANVGDCQAILVTETASEEWSVEVLTTDHNGDNDAEIARVRHEHPGEEECIIDRRVLGALAPTRCLGDVPFKQPPAFSRRILYNILPGFHDKSPWEEFLVRNLTPPYITAEADVIWKRLDDVSPPLSATAVMPSILLVPDQDTTKRKHRHRRTSTAPALKSSGFFARAVGLFSAAHAHISSVISSTPQAPKLPILQWQYSSESDAPSMSTSNSTGSNISADSTDSANSGIAISYKKVKETPRRFLILASDGFVDLCKGNNGPGIHHVVQRWAKKLDDAPFETPTSIAPSVSTSPTTSLRSQHRRQTSILNASASPAVRLLREAVGAEDRYTVSKVLTLDMDESWMDDTAIVVVGF